ncbi:BON domain-containing protein [Micromonospora sp. NPDC047738]|uniref:BON domain-containing protein n=1 Tax=unclassified Micromonospora TaxID=2617518 RepID=UPI003406A838
MVMPWAFPPFPDDNPSQPTNEESAPESEDLRLAALVAQRLSIDWITRRQQITITVQNRVVILAGMVANVETRRAAGELAWEVPGVVDVCNALQLYGQRRSRR